MITKEGKFNFAEAYQELEKINEWFQNEDIDLDEGLKKFKRGLELIKQCKERLRKIENQFHEIRKEYSVEETEPEKDEVSNLFLPEE